MIFLFIKSSKSSFLDYRGQTRFGLQSIDRSITKPTLKMTTKKQKVDFLSLFSLSSFVSTVVVINIFFLFSVDSFFFLFLFSFCFFFFSSGIILPFWAAAPKGSMTYAFTHMGNFLQLLLLLLRTIPQSPASRPKFQSRGPNPSLEAQILAARPKS